MNYYTFLYKLRVIFVGILIIVSIPLLLFLITSSMVNNVKAMGTDNSSSSTAADMSDSPNVITSGMSRATEEVGHSIDSTALAINNGIKSFASATAQSSKGIVDGAKTGTTTTARVTGNSLAFVGRSVGSGVASVFKVPGKVLGFASNTSVVSSVIRPSDHVEVPIIDPNSPELIAALNAMPPTEAASQETPQNNSGAAWPIHGRITTEFGVPHRPYQHTHTGIDISDSRPSGVTPVKPFRPGRVIDTVLTSRGLGNHLIIDHGNGVTSVYAHLASISVRVGQDVGLATVIGFVGSTGVSTGTHLHFEIRVNGKAADPHQFISGQP